MTILRAKSFHVLLTVAVLLGGAEAMLRWRAVRKHGSAGVQDTTLYQSDPVFGRILRPNAALAGEQVQLHVNSLGFRGPEIGPDKPAGTFRVAVLGDSVVFGRYARDEEVWTARLQQRLTERLGRPVEVINAGVPGYTAETDIEVLRRRILPLAPDLVLVCQFMGDLNAACDGLGGPVGEGAAPARSLTDTSTRLRIWRDRNLLSYHLIRKNLTPLVTPVQAGLDRRDAMPAGFTDAYRTHLAALVAQADAAGVPIVLTTPWRAISRRQDIRVQLDHASTTLMNKPHISLEGLHDAFERFEAAVRDVAGSTDAELIDLAEMIPADGSLFMDTVHFSPAGHAKAAELLTEPLAEILEETHGLP